MRSGLRQPAVGPFRSSVGPVIRFQIGQRSLLALPLLVPSLALSLGLSQCALTLGQALFGRCPTPTHPLQPLAEQIGTP